MNEIIRTSLAASGNSLEIDGDTGHVRVRNEALLRSHGIDSLVYLAAFGNPERQPVARWLIWEAAQALDILPNSIFDFYNAGGHDQFPRPFTTPAINLRAMTYDLARAAFRAAIKAKVGAFMFELSRSEMIHTDQRPAEYTSVILAAAIKEGFRGPVFLQADHIQVNAYDFKTNTEVELTGLRNLIRESLHAGFYNVELDTSTLVDPGKPTLDEQQYRNYELCATLTDYMRSLQPQKMVISVGGEIGELSTQNSTVQELRVFMDHYKRRIHHAHGLSKLAVRAGTSTGGVVLADGTLAGQEIDFARLKELATIARHEYAMGGVVQHGASTLPLETLHQFVEAGAVEVHLATAFQNWLFEMLPAGLLNEVRLWLLQNVAQKRLPGDTEAQFLYKTRRLATGPFKKQLWNLPEDERARIRLAFEDHFTQLYQQLAVTHTQDMVASTITPFRTHKGPADFDSTQFLVQPGNEPVEA
jgi:fructose/tagatose bisphosphate aldolase